MVELASCLRVQGFLAGFFCWAGQFLPDVLFFLCFFAQIGEKNVIIEHENAF